MHLHSGPADVEITENLLQKNILGCPHDKYIWHQNASFLIFLLEISIFFFPQTGKRTATLE
uniref:Uncharacterized protein n=1 Tax=Arundo donax TaxID=35708 RepID=A0A0A9HU02_ARUDO